MGLRTFSPVKYGGGGRVKVGGSFLPKGTSAPVKSSGKGWSVSRSDVGIYTITLDRAYNDLEGLSLTVRVADTTATIVQGGDYSDSAGTLLVHTLQESTGTFALADLSDDADNEVHFEMTLKDHSGNF